MNVVKIVSVVGARPQFVKLAPIARAAAQTPGLDHIIVHTGQHYDHAMSEGFFDDLGIPAPKVNLGVGSGSHADQTGSMMAKLAPLFEEIDPDWVLAFGDTNSTLAAAVTAVKLAVPLAHLEAGLRSFNREMPEEHNRVLTDHAADLCLAPSQRALEQLASEGLASRSILVGDVMTDEFRAVAARVEANAVPSPIDDREPYFLATIHRPSNTDDSHRLREILDALSSLPTLTYLAAHPRLRSIVAGREWGDSGALRWIEPLSYPQMVQGLLGARGVITDSGGLQKEAYLAGVPCTTIRNETEWTETLDGGWNVLCPDTGELAHAVKRDTPSGPRPDLYGDGNAARRVLAAMESERV